MRPGALRLGTTVRVRGIGDRTARELVVTAVRGPYAPGGAVTLVGYRPGTRALVEAIVGATRELEVLR